MTSWFRDGEGFTSKLFEFVVPLRPDQWYTIGFVYDETTNGYRRRPYVGIDLDEGPIILADEIREALESEPEFQAYSLQRRRDCPAISFRTEIEAVSFRLRWG